MGMSSRPTDTAPVTECQDALQQYQNKNLPERRIFYEQDRLTHCANHIDEFTERSSGTIRDDLVADPEISKPQSAGSVRTSKVLDSLQSAIADCNRWQKEMDGTIKELVQSLMSYCDDSDKLLGI